MRIAKALFVDPDRNFAHGVLAVAISFFVFAYSPRFGKAPILAYYAVWLPLILIDYRQALGNYVKFTWIIAFAAFAFLSIFWSDAPGVSARAAIQYATHVACALIAARTVSMRTFTVGALAGVVLVGLYSLAAGGYHVDALDGSLTFVGAFASKNQLGFFASVGIYFAIAALFVFGERGILRLLALICLAMSAYLLLASHSATSIIATAATLAMLTALGLLLWFRPRTRSALLVFGIMLALLVAFAALGAGGMDVLLGAFGKDTTLTGRTYLWQQGLEAAGQNPFFGVGYYAYWVQGFPEAERLWEEFYITARTGFHFHNTYIETLVELGLVGLIPLVFVVLRVPSGHLMRLLEDHRNVDSYLAFGLTAMLLVRSFFEVDVINPYVLGSFLLYYTAGLLALPQRVVQLSYRARRARLQTGPA
jgi:exopolysaccharide production protein ExoQ